jgi:2-polyprenyl-3-methyl-5-hydroxy-6-metoxy-1,4-benzoquinol methylase
MSRLVDPEGTHVGSVRRLADLRRLRVIELGCGDGRLTVPVARDAARVLAIDPDAEAIERARHSLPADLTDRVEYRVASGDQIQVERGSFDLAFFSWSL